jgi:hypothetical protein
MRQSNKFMSMKLTDSLAARRLVYRRVTSALPDMVVIDIPQRHAASTLPLGRFYPVIVETDLEMIEFEHFIGLNRPALVVPDLLDRRASTLQGAHIMLCHYDPAEAGWPYILLCQWPGACTHLVREDEDMLARGVYTIEMFPTASDRSDAAGALMASLCKHGLAPALLTC